MKRLILIAALFAVPATAQVQVDGYYRRDGTYVPPHTRSSPNSTKLDNYSTQGNTNPYNGRQGSVDPYKPSSNNPYGTPNNSGGRKSSYDW
jgi:hypothetical protein